MVIPGGARAGVAEAAADRAPGRGVDPSGSSGTRIDFTPPVWSMRSCGGASALDGPPCRAGYLFFRPFLALPFDLALSFGFRFPFAVPSADVRGRPGRGNGPPEWSTSGRLTECLGRDPTGSGRS